MTSAALLLVPLVIGNRSLGLAEAPAGVFSAANVQAAAELDITGVYLC